MARLERALLVTSGEKNIEAFTELLRAAEYREVQLARSGSDARRQIDFGDFPLIVINAPLSDELGHEFAQDASERTGAGVILLVRGELAEELGPRLEEYGVIVLEKPAGRTLFVQAVRIVTAMQRRLSGLRQENAQLQKKMDEMRLVNRAKAALMTSLGLTEPQAHRYIEKQAMDLRIPRAEVARNILRTYENTV